MIPELLFDPEHYDISKPLIGKDTIRKHNAQRYEMEMLDGVILFDRAKHLIGGFYHLETESWWARGHFPDRAMLPGVLGVESVGQLASIYFHEYSSGLRMGLAKLGEIRYIRPMEPPNVLYIGARLRHRKLRFAHFEIQGFINKQIAFYGEFTGGAI